MQDDLCTLPRACIDALALEASRIAPHRVPLYRAMRDCGVVLAEVWPGARMRPPCRLPNGSVAIIGDDFNGLDPGPGGFHRKTLRGLLAASDFVCVHATGAELWQYQYLADLAVAGRRAVLIETGSARLEAWLRCVTKLRRPPDLVCLPSPGEVHPVAGAPAGVTVQ